MSKYIGRNKIILKNFHLNLQLKKYIIYLQTNLMFNLKTCSYEEE